MKRVFLIVLDSVGIGGAPDAADFGDEGSDTLASCAATGLLELPNLVSLGLGNISGVTCLPKTDSPRGAFCRLSELSRGKDTTIGHWEIAGIVSPKPLPTYPDGFPEDLIDAFRQATGRGVLCNKPISGTEAIRLYGDEHLATGDLIVYTSADSVFQIAAHEDKVPVEELYEICRKARALFQCKRKDLFQRNHGSMALDLAYVLSSIALRAFETADHDFIYGLSRLLIKDMAVDHLSFSELTGEYLLNHVKSLISGHTDDAYSALSICS